MVLISLRGSVDPTAIMWYPILHLQRTDHETSKSKIIVMLAFHVFAVYAVNQTEHEMP
jgi:hypothetical protein